MTISAASVIVIASGGLPVTNLGANGAVPLTVVPSGGAPVTLVASGGLPVTLLNPDGSLYAMGFNPLTLFAGGVQGAWFDPSDLTTLFKDAAGTTPVTADGDQVALMKDKSGNGWNVSQATSSLCPLWHTGSGLSWLTWDGVDDIMESAANYSFAFPEYLAACFLKSSDTTAQGVLSNGSATTHYHSLESGGNSNKGTHGMRGPPTSLVQMTGTSSMPNGSAYVLEGLTIAGLNSIGLNGGTFTTAANDGTAPGTDTLRKVGFRRWAAGSAVPAPTNWYGGLMVRSDVAATRAQIVTWLGAKGGLTL